MLKSVVWDYKHVDYGRFRHTDWDTIINDDNSTNNVRINFTDEFLTVAKESIPHKMILLRENKTRTIISREVLNLSVAYSDWLS